MEQTKKVRKKETEEEKKKRIAKITKGVKAYHSCCKKANCGSKNKMVKKEKNTIKKYLTKPKPKATPKPTPKPKPKATPKPTPKPKPKATPTPKKFNVETYIKTIQKLDDELTKLRELKGLKKKQIPNFCNNPENTTNRGNCQNKVDFLIDQIKQKSKGQLFISGVESVKYYQKSIEQYKEEIKKEREALKPTPKPKPKRKFDDEMLMEKRYEIEEKRLGIGEFGMEYKIISPETCKEIIKMSKNLIKLKNNGYKRNTEVNLLMADTTTSKFDGKKSKHYKLPKIEVVMRFLSYIKNKEQILIDVKKDCGEQELLFLEKALEIMEKDRKLIKDTIIKQRSKYIKNDPLPEF